MVLDKKNLFSRIHLHLKIVGWLRRELTIRSIQITHHQGVVEQLNNPKQIALRDKA